MSPLLTILLCLPIALADYDCLCNYHVEVHVYAHASNSSAGIGYLYEFDCKPIDHVHPAPNADFMAIQYEKKTGYVAADKQITQETCSGSPPLGDLVPVTQAASTTIPTTPTTSITTTTPTTTTTTPTTTTTTPTTTTTMTPTTTTTPATTTTTPTTTTTAPMPTTIPKGNVSLCPAHIITDAARVHGILTQYGNYCYELVPRKTDWSSADTHCHFLRKGRLMYITNVGEQNFITEFLTSHHYVDKVWIGLTDRGHEGNYTWSGSGAPLTYTNFDYDFNMHPHAAYDCIVMQQGGKWIDTECHSGIFTHRHAPKYASICQYHVNTTLGSIVDLIHGIVG